MRSTPICLTISLTVSDLAALNHDHKAEVATDRSYHCTFTPSAQDKQRLRIINNGHAKTPYKSNRKPYSNDLIKSYLTIHQNPVLLPFI